jgi:hypothetical protein
MDITPHPALGLKILTNKETQSRANKFLYETLFNKIGYWVKLIICTCLHMYEAVWRLILTDHVEPKLFFSGGPNPALTFRFNVGSGSELLYGTF